MLENNYSRNSCVNSANTKYNHSKNIPISTRMKLYTIEFFKLQCWLHRCWWRMLETKCVGDNFAMLATDFRCWWPISCLEKITKIMKKTPTKWFCHQHLKSVGIITSPTKRFDQRHCSRIVLWLLLDATVIRMDTTSR